MALGLPGAKRKAAKRLAGLAIDDNSGVDRPAHGSPGWAVRKATDIDARIETLVERLEKQLGDEQEDEPMDDLIKALTGAKDRLPEAAQPLVEQLAKALAGDKVDDPVAVATAATKAAEARASTAEAEATRLRKALAGVDDKPTEAEVLTKALGDLPEPVRKAFESMQTRLTKAETDTAGAVKKAAEEREARVSREYLEKARDPGLRGLAVKAETLGTVLREVDDRLSKEASTELIRVLRAASETITRSDAFDELGGMGADATDEDTQVNAEADQIQKAARAAGNEVHRATALIQAADIVAARNGRH